MRTISVIFTDKRVPRKAIPSFKKYKFLCDYDYVGVFDIIKDPRYDTLMMIVDIDYNKSPIQEGIVLKEIYITEINGVIISNDKLKSMIMNENTQKIRKIEVSLQQAQEWYNSGNDTLKSLALNVFKEEELNPSLDYIKSKVVYCALKYEVPSTYIKNFQTLADLAVVAKYFNGDWKKTRYNEGYCIVANNALADKYYENIGIQSHVTVKHAGVIYFSSKENLIRAIQIIGVDKIKELID